MSGKIIFCDLDGTLIENHALIDPNIATAIKQFRQDNLFVINTGRNLDEAYQNLVDLGVPFDYLILNNGGHIIDENQNEIVKKEITPAIGAAVMKVLKGNAGLNLTFYNGSNTYLKEGHETKILVDGTFKTAQDDFDEAFEASKSYDIICAFQQNREIDVVQRIMKELENVAVTCNLNDIYLDISPEGSTKGNGARYLMEYLDFKGTCYGIGDSYNDISMFEVVDFGVTFTHCLEQIKEQADLIVSSVGELIKKVG